MADDLEQSKTCTSNLWNVTFGLNKNAHLFQDVSIGYRCIAFRCITYIAIHILTPSLISVITIGWFRYNRLNFHSQEMNARCLSQRANTKLYTEIKYNATMNNSFSLSCKCFTFWFLNFVAKSVSEQGKTKPKWNETSKWTHQTV